jgi:chromosome segregation ATPase
VKLFSGRTAELKTMNRILTDAARKRGQRVEELELELGRVKSEYVLRVQRIEELELKLRHYERVDAEARRLERELAAAHTEIARIDHPRLEAERAFYRKRADELEEHNRQLTEAATKCSLRVQELEQELTAARTEIATNDFFRVQAERDFYRKRIVELEQHNREVTEAATQRASRVQELEGEVLQTKSRLQDAQQLNESCAATIKMLNTRLARSEAKPPTRRT